jgi:hypothetical protein
MEWGLVIVPIVQFAALIPEPVWAGEENRKLLDIWALL